MNAFQDFGREIAADQERRSRRLDLEAARSKLESEMSSLREHGPARLRVFVAAACAAAATATAVGWWARHPAASFRVAGEEVAARESPWISPSDEQPVPIDFHD
jgi:hypothetical protein